MICGILNNLYYNYNLNIINNNTLTEFANAVNTNVERVFYAYNL